MLKNKLLAASSIFIILAIVITAVLMWPNPATVTANNKTIALSTGRSIAAPATAADVYDAPANRHYYITVWAGTGDIEKRDPFRPVIADYCDDWGVIDLRKDSKQREGYAIGYADCPVIDTAGVIYIGDSPFDNLTEAAKYSIETLLRTDTGIYTLSEYLAEILINQSSEYVTKALNPENDGKYRIYCGELLYGDERTTELTHNTIQDNFNRSGSTLGTSSDGDWAWVDRTSDAFNTTGTMAESTNTGSMSEAYADADEPTTANHYVQADLTDHPTPNYCDGGIAIRMATDEESYYAFYNVQEGGYWSLFKFNDGSYSVITTESDGFSGAPAGETYYMEINGDTITCKVDGDTIITDTGDDEDLDDFTHTGLSSYKNLYWDNFESDDLGGGTTSVTAGPDTKAFGIIHVDSINWSFGSEPSWPLADEDAYFYIYNDGDTTIDVTANCTDGTGGIGSTAVMGSPGEDEFRLSLFEEGDGSTDNLTLTTTQQAWLSSKASSSNTSFEVKLEIGTSSEVPPTGKTITIYFIASAS